MNAHELRATLSLAGVFMLRMLGIFLILPVFAVYASVLPGATPLLVGLALGIYGLTQALLQIPYGWASDRLGRKRMIAAGLVVFALGSLGAAVAPDIGWMVAARALQGAGAVGAVTLALLADLTRAEFRTRAMAVVGVSIGASFAVSIVLGPVLDAWIGVRGIFLLICGLAVVAIVVVWKVVPGSDVAVPVGAARTHARALLRRDTVGAVPSHRDGSGLVWGLIEPKLIPHHVGAFLLHAILTALFIALPVVLVERLGLASVDMWKLYLPVLAASVVLMLPFVLAADRPAWRRPVLPLGVGVLLLALVVLGAGHTHLAGIAAGLVLFFTAFNFLEAALPARVSQLAPAGSRGAVLGVHSSGQFLGTFAGGVAGGAAWGLGGPPAVFGLCVLLALVWMVWAARDARDAAE